MEIPNKNEYLKIKGLLYNNLPNCLWERDINNKDYRNIDSHLKNLKLPKPPEAYERKILFGRQFRYSFGPPADVTTGLNGLMEAVRAFASDGMLISDYKDVDSAKSHKLVQLNYNPRKRIFYHKPVSKLIFHLTIRELEKLK
jgi:hypothetical protein